VLLPPSETKRAGGDGGLSLDLAALGYPGLSAQRAATVDATRSLAANPGAMAVALKLGPSQHGEVERNRLLGSAPVMPAIDRYTGVLYDALDAATLSPRSREFANQTVVIHSALFGLIHADDAIPAYRLSHDSRLPGLRLRSLWGDAIAQELQRHDGLILDLRSEAYVSLGPVPSAGNSFYLRVVAAGPTGHKRALNHFNKKGKGEFVRALLDARIDHPDAPSLLAWAANAGIDLTLGAAGELQLEVEQIAAGARRARA